MRPRVFPAEDGLPESGRTRSRTASMRPRVFPAEDGHCRVCQGTGTLASMRPRVFPAEDLMTGRPPTWRTQRFNEAAGIPRGRPTTQTTPRDLTYMLQ